MSVKLDLLGKVFGELTVSAMAGANKWGNTLWECQCTCGNVCVVAGGKLHSGQQSCGCLNKCKHITTLTQKELKQLLHYNQKTGIFTWKVNRGTYKCRGSKVTYINSNGYVCVNIQSKLYYVHRLAFLYVVGYLPEYEIDHINGVRTDNRWSNLRHVTVRCNTHNTGLRSTNNSNITGVYFSKKQNVWVAQGSCNNKSTYIGSSPDKVEAALLRYTWEQCEGFTCTERRGILTFLKEAGCINRTRMGDE